MYKPLAQIETLTIIVLERLDLSENNLSGPPGEIFSLGRIRLLYLSDNSGLSGSLPATVDRLANIRELYLENTGIGGDLPTQFYTLATLREIHFTNSRFSGSISGDMVNMVNLELVDFSFNRFSGRIPNIWGLIPDLGKSLLSTNPGLTVVLALTLPWLPIPENVNLLGNPDLTGSITKEDCDARGGNRGDIETIFVDCDIECFLDCCDKPGGCS